MPLWLLDINVLIAWKDADHEHHIRAAAWWQQHATDGWATCPLTENGFVSILGQSSYPGWPGTPERAAVALRQLIARCLRPAFLAGRGAARVD